MGEPEPSEPDRNYPYSNYIKSPGQLGASPKGTMEALKKDVRVLGDYVDVLVSGVSKAQVGGQPLGNKYFLATKTDCKDSGGVAHPRFIFVNNIPQVTSFSSARGLVPGILQDIAYINPSKLFSAFTQSDVCRQVEMETRDINNQVAKESQYVLDDDLKTYPPSWFPDNKNPVTGEEGPSSSKSKKKKKKEKFTNKEEDITIPEFVFYFGFFLLLVYLFSRMLSRR
jgi:hypothetical protein